MNRQDSTADFDQTDEDILSYTVSDEALEAAVGTEGAAITVWSCREGQFGNCH
jgi:hypothetical protein